MDRLTAIDAAAASLAAQPPMAADEPLDAVEEVDAEAAPIARYGPRPLGGYGERRSMTALGNGLAAQAPDLIREEISRPPYVDAFCKALLNGLRNGERTALRLYPELHKLVGTQVDLAVTVVNLVGAPPDRARRAVDMLSRVEGQGEQAMMRRAAAALKDYCTRQGWPLDLPAGLTDDAP